MFTTWQKLLHCLVILCACGLLSYYLLPCSDSSFHPLNTIFQSWPEESFKIAGCTERIWLLCYCVALQLPSPRCEFHLSCGTHNNHSGLIDAFISRLPLPSEAFSSCSPFIRTQSTSPSAQSWALWFSETLFNASNYLASIWLLNTF